MQKTTDPRQAGVRSDREHLIGVLRQGARLCISIVCTAVVVDHGGAEVSAADASLSVVPLAQAGNLSLPLRAGVDPVTGLPEVTIGGSPLVETQYVFWGAAWRWASMMQSVHAVSDVQPTAQIFRTEATVDDLALRLSASTRQDSAQSINWRWRVETTAPRSVVIGGGLSFKLRSEQFREVLGMPELLPSGAGWAWGRADGGRIEMRFDPPPRNVYFERGRPEEVRVMFLRDDFDVGTQQIAGRLTLVGPDAKAMPTRGQRLLLPDTRNWPVLPGRLPDGPLDLRSLNAHDRPAGRHGRIRADGERLVFGDGSTARLWGTNITALALFQTHAAEVRAEARRLARMGYNLVRLHHHDSHWVDPNIFGLAPRFDTKEINERMARQIDWWIKCLADEGIYVWLDLHVGRHVRSQDGITGYEEIAKGTNGADIRGYNYVNPSIQEAMWQFARDYLTRKSSETGRSPIEEPAVAFVLLTNENDLTFHFGNALLADKKVPWHHARFREAVDQFATIHRMSADAVARTWEPGPAKLFLNDLEFRTHAAMISRLRDLGLKALVASTNYWGDEPQFSLPALTVGDVIDVHAYALGSQLEVSPHYGQTLFDFVAQGSVLGRPTTVSEWNIDALAAPDRQALPLMMAARASQQGVSALMHYAHTQQPPLGQGWASQWDSYADPAWHDLMPLAALVYRQAMVSLAEERFVYGPSSEQLFGAKIPFSTQAALRLASRRGRLHLRLPHATVLGWLKPAPTPSGARILSDTDLSAVQGVGPGGRFGSANGEVTYDWEIAQTVIDAPKAFVMSGGPASGRSASGAVEVSSATPHSTVSVISQDGRHLREAGAVVMAIVGRSAPQDGTLLPYRQEVTSAKVRWGGRSILLGTAPGHTGSVVVVQRP
jgi:hypothetical protein